MPSVALPGQATGCATTLSQSNRIGTGTVENKGGQQPSVLFCLPPSIARLQGSAEEIPFNNGVEGATGV